uniref:AWPM-19-like family protein n=1 Tax=Oryza punctata TaxID=4537 RepID=A0A0E0M8F4_ORYPU
MALEHLGRRNVAGPLLLLNLLMYVFMLGFAGWALNSSIKNAGVDVDVGVSWGEQLQRPWTPYYRQSAWLASRFHLATFAALAAALGVAAKVSAAYHGGRSGASWKPQGLAAAASLGTAAWAATALAFGMACREMHDAAAAGAAGAARGWRMRALEGLTVTLAFTQLLYVLLLHAAVAGERCGLACPADA